MMQSATPLTGHVSGHVASAFRTLGLLHLRSEQRVSRGAPRTVLRSRDGAGWQDMPAWRFFRHVIRAGLFLRERCRLQPGDRVVVIAPLGAERIIAEWAIVVQGGVVATVDPGTPDDALSRALAYLSPRVAFVADGAVRDRVLHLGIPVERFILTDGVARIDTSDVSWSSMLDLAGTLDTPERAQAFRAAARGVRPDMPAVAYPDVQPTGRLEWKTASHAAIVDRLVDLWRSSPSRPGDEAYAVDPGEYGGLRIALWALIADGATTVILGSPEREAQDIAELRPSVVVGSVEALERAAQRPSVPPAEGAPRSAPWLRWFPRLSPPKPARRAVAGAPPSRSLTLEGSSWPVTLPIAQR
jgi:hypothetical protein